MWSEIKLSVLFKLFCLPCFFFVCFFFSLIHINGALCPSAPLKGIPKAPFRSPTAPSMFSPPSNRTPITPARTPLRKERGVKVL